MARWQKAILTAGAATALIAVLVWAGLAIAQRDADEGSSAPLLPQAEAPPGSGSPGPDPGLGRPRRTAPNIVVLLTDDQPASAFSPAVMPRTFELLTERGVRFGEAIAAPPLCCPFRAGLFTGQYAHNNGVKRNRPGYTDLRDPELVLPAFLRNAGYRTGFIGKYLNGTAAELGGEAAPGWDRWYQLVERSYRGPTVSDDGEIRELDRSQRTTKVVSAEAVEFIERSSAQRKPFFLTAAYYAPHPDRQGRVGPCVGQHTAKASWLDYRRVRDVRAPVRPSYGERNVSDKPRWLRSYPPLGPRDEVASEHRWRCALAAVQPVDHGIKAIVEALEQEGELDRTWIVFGSDNGYHFGEHRLVGKRGFYEEMLRVPLVIRPPDGRGRFRWARGTQRAELVSEIDVATTILEISGARPCLPGLGCRRPDGRSLLPLLAGDERGWPADRGIPLQLGDCRLTGLRTPDRVVIQTSQYKRGCRPVFTELYNLRSDPRQLRNLADERPEQVRALRRRMADALRCRGAGPPEGKPHRHSCE